MFTDKTNYRYVLDYDLEHSPCTCCEDEYSDGYCRCTSITGCEVPKSISNALSFWESCYSGPKDPLEQALSFWFLRLNFKNIVWDYESEGGYYGEELKSVHMESDGGFWNRIPTFAALTTTEKIHLLLTLEYLTLLPQIREVKDWQAKCVPVRLVENSANKHLDPKVLEDYTNFCHRVVQNKRSGLSHKTQHLAPLCLEAEGHFQVMDGRHRCTVLQKEYQLYSSRSSSKNERKTYKPKKMWIICPK